MNTTLNGEADEISGATLVEALQGPGDATHPNHFNLTQVDSCSRVPLVEGGSECCPGFVKAAGLTG